MYVDLTRRESKTALACALGLPTDYFVSFTVKVWSCAPMEVTAEYAFPDRQAGFLRTQYVGAPETISRAVAAFISALAAEKVS